jgi:hypothetical protein
MGTEKNQGCETPQAAGTERLKLGEPLFIQIFGVHGI